MSESAEAVLRKKAIESMLRQRAGMSTLQKSPTDIYVAGDKLGRRAANQDMEDGEVYDEQSGNSDSADLPSRNGLTSNGIEGQVNRGKAGHGEVSEQLPKSDIFKASDSAPSIQTKISPSIQAHAHLSGLSSAQSSSGPSTPSGGAASLPKRSRFGEKSSDEESQLALRQKPSSARVGANIPLSPPTHPQPDVATSAAAKGLTPPYFSPTLYQPAKPTTSTGPIPFIRTEDSPPSPCSDPATTKMKSDWEDSPENQPQPSAETDLTPAISGGKGKWASRSSSREPEDGADIGGDKALGGVARAAKAAGDASVALDLFENRLRPPLRSVGSQGTMEVWEVGGGEEAVDAAGHGCGGNEDGDGAGRDGGRDPLQAGMGLHQCRDVHTAYERLNKIDEGTYGVVQRSKCMQSGRIVALKQVKLEHARDGFPLTALRELTVLLELKHVNIVEVFEVVMCPEKQVYMVMEYMDHDFRSLMEAMPRHFLPSQVKCLMHQLLSGVEYMHRHWVIHRDLKASNLLLDNNGVLKICDFGLARLYMEPIKAMTPNVVTLWYRAPELLYGDKSYNVAVDMWSVGCIFGELLLKAPLIQAKNETEMVEKIAQLIGSPTEESWPGFKNLPGPKPVRKHKNTVRDKIPKVSYTGGPSLTDGGYDLLMSLLAYNPAHRKTAQAALKHPWFDEAPLKAKPHEMPTYPSMHEVPKGQRKRARADGDLPTFAAQVSVIRGQAGVNRLLGPLPVTPLGGSYYSDDARFGRE